jgi:cytochrome c biogenesis protein CcdA
VLSKNHELMESWIQQVLGSGQAGIAVLPAVFLLGMIGVVTCGCNYAIFAMIAGYSGSLKTSGRTRSAIWSGITFLIGAVVSMAAIGALFGYAGGLVGDSFGTLWKIAAGLICVFFGLNSMNLLPFRVPSFSIKHEGLNTGILSAILFGLAVGGLSTAFNTCCNPIFPIILAASFVKGSTFWGLLMLSVFALGYAFPLALGMVGLKLGLEKVSGGMSKLGNVVKYTGGILLLVMGFYFLITV